MLKVIDTVSLYDDKRFALNVFSKLLNKSHYSIFPYKTNNAVSFRSDFKWQTNRMKHPGVYIIYHNNKIIYIGQSERSMHTRIIRFLKAVFDCQGSTESHPGGEKFREYMKRSYDAIPETDKTLNFDEWLLSQPLTVTICQINEHFYVNTHEGEYAYLTESERPFLDEFLAGAMKRIPKFNSKVQRLFDNQLFDDPSGVTNNEIAEVLDKIMLKRLQQEHSDHVKYAKSFSRHRRKHLPNFDNFESTLKLVSNLENLVMEKNDMTTIFEDLTEQDHAWLDGLTNRANSGFRNKVLDQVLSLNVGKGFKFPTTCKSGFNGSWVRKQALESNPNIALTFRNKENYCYVKRTA